MSVHSPETFERPEGFGPGSVWVDRVATRQFVGRTQSGVEIPIGLEDGRVSVKTSRRGSMRTVRPRRRTTATMSLTSRFSWIFPVSTSASEKSSRP